MTADDARALTHVRADADAAKVRIVLGLWYDGIRRAADAGHRVVREWELDRVRTPIPATARYAALAKLRENGFSVKQVEEDRGTTTEVSW